ncbi:hypothetical protein NM688_g5435 [Phlebia brevispora]|uniref:Uncharacterized protein n=1 Tax=Phlebia brevispora TaxID=194682 RepID=A0ACC1SVW3_9APHY|nr:hypothetical protein NM688_g5435 [Phlebia brevispora]
MQKETGVAKSSGLLDHRMESNNFEEIPVIDIQDVFSSDALARRTLANRIRDACINVGFFYVANHGIPQSVIEDALAAGKRFFALPQDAKALLDIHKSPNFKGYTPLLGENTDPANRGDLHEGFDIGWEDLAGISRSDDGVMTGDNVWPEALPGFREAVLQYYHAVVKLGKALFPLFALALDLPENFFDDKTTKPAAIMRLLHYPPQTGVLDERVLGIGAHTDYECFTILWQDSNVQALQVLNNSRKWIDAVPIPGTFVVKAVNRSGIERYSIPLFFGTDYNVKLEALPSCVSEDCPAKYPVVTAGEYVKSRLEATYAHSK